MSVIYRLSLPIPFPVRQVNCYYIADSTPTLVDCGLKSEEAFEGICAGVQQAGGELSRIKRILLTHGHADHMGLAGKIAERSGAEVFMHQWDWVTLGEEESEHEVVRRPFRRFLEEGGVEEGAFARKLVELIFERFRALADPLRAFSAIGGGETFGFDDFELQTIHTPGHSPGSLCFFDGHGGRLFSGDSLIEEIIANPAMEAENLSAPPQYKALSAYEASLDTIEKMQVNKVFPGHGQRFSDYRDRVERLRMHHRLRREEVLHILNQRANEDRTASGMTALSVAEALFKPLNGIDIFHGISAARCHLEYLEDLGRVAHESRNGLFYYVPL